MTSRLDRRHVLITGAGGGIGLAMAQACLAEGARCSLVDRATDTPSAVQAVQDAHPDAVAYIAADITRSGDIARLLDTAVARFGPVHTLVNNAAVFDLAPLLESDEASFDRLFAVNVKGLFFVMQAVLRHMVEAGTEGASVINLASQAGRRGEALVSHYCATKAAVISYTQSAALAMAPHGIRVNSVCPGFVATPMQTRELAWEAQLRGSDPETVKQMWIDDTPLGRLETPEDVAKVVAFLASDDAEFLTGESISVNGGAFMD